MKRLTCEMCGGTDLIKQDGVFVCQNCGMKYSVEDAKKMMIEGTVDVKVDNSHMIENYLEMANNAYDSSNEAEAESYCNKIIEIDPSNYQAWMLKGKASGWQSTLQNSRVPEAISAFLKGIANAPEEEKDELVEEVKEEIINLSHATISLHGDHFAKWPDDEEASEFILAISDILQELTQFMQMSGVKFSNSDFLEPVAMLINQSVVKAYQNVIYPEYKSDRYPYPDHDDWQKFIERIDLCIKLVEFSISFCDDDDEKNIQRYKNLISLEQDAIDSCSYDSKYFDYDPYNFGRSTVRDNEKLVRSYGWFPDSANSRYYFVNYTLTDTAKSIRRMQITSYNEKIKDIKEAKEKREKEEAQKRFNDYWAEHAEQKVSLEAEKKDIFSQISALNASYDDQVAVFRKEIAAIPGKTEIDNIEERIKKLSEEQSALGLFKGKEKKALQEQIDQAISEKQAIQDRMDAVKKEIETKITSLKAEFQKKVKPLLNRVNTIYNELTKER